MKYLNRLSKWQYLLFAINGLSMIINTNGKPLKYSIDPKNNVGKIVQRYNIDVYKHRVKDVDYLELHTDNDEENFEVDMAQKTRNYIRILEYKEKNDQYNKKMNSKKDEFDIATDIKNKANVIWLNNNSTESHAKKNTNAFNFHIFCIDSTMEKCEKIKTNLNSIGESLETQLNIKEPINIMVKTVPFCKSMNKDCGAVKSNAITTPTSFYSLIDEIDERPYLYPQALVKQLDIEGSVDFTLFDINLTINTDIDYWYWSDEQDIKPGQIDFQHAMAHEILHGMGVLSSLNQSFKKDFTYIFNIVSSQKDHTYLLPYFHYGYNGYFNAPIIKEVLPLFIFDKYLNVYDQTSDYNTPIWNYLSPLYESDKVKENYVTLAIKEVEENIDIIEGASYLYNYALNSQWVFNKDDSTIFQNGSGTQTKNKKNSSIPIDTLVFNEWFDGLSGSHTQCDTFYHVARNKEDGVMCTLVNESEQLFEKNSPLLGKKELTILSSIGWSIVNSNYDSDETITTSENMEEIFNNNKIEQPVNVRDQIEAINDDDDYEENELEDEFEGYHLKKRNIQSSKKSKYYFSNI